MRHQVIVHNLKGTRYTLCLKKSSHPYTICNFVKS